MSLGSGFFCVYVHDIGKDVKDTMKLTAKDKTRYLYEYAFYDVIRDYNESQVTESRPDYIMASEGRMFRTRLGQRLASEGKSMETLRIPDFIAATNAVLSERMGHARMRTEMQVVVCSITSSPTTSRWSVWRLVRSPR